MMTGREQALLCMRDSVFWSLSHARTALMTVYTAVLNPQLYYNLLDGMDHILLTFRFFTALNTLDEEHFH